ncbi:hypothetical protein ACFW1A_03485 [Kitasatospora sp. NPDC058965]|uniref:hypothetical protein n=1 Tax=Kitasatospora sp. NPDC058965 TaxID=3346682 RepID=UPI0036856E65
MTHREPAADRPTRALRPPRAVGYAYPWDFLDDPAAPGRACALGLDAVAVAAAYHTVRAASPLHPARRLTEAPYAACYVPIREEAWRGRRLRPARPTWLNSADPFGEARGALHAAGLQVYAWTVLTHNSRLGRANPDLTVRNAFGEHYPYALCPAAEEVADYCAALVREVVSTGQPDGLVLEACGQLGVVHGGHHDKADLAGWTATQQRLLSLCFCTACERNYREAALDPGHLSAAVRHALGPTGSADCVEDALGRQVATALAGIRARTTEELRSRTAAQARAVDPGLRLVLHASPDPWATGPFATVAAAAAGTTGPADALVASCWQPGPTGTASLRGLRATAGPGTRVGGYLLADASWDAGDTAERVAAYRDAGMDELHLYHLGLTGRAGLRRMAAILTAAGQEALPT